METERILWKEKTRDEAAKRIEQLQQAPTECPVMNMSKFLEALIPESCGECVICREGIYQLYVQLQNITLGLSSEDDFQIIKEIADSLETVSSCEFGKVVGSVVKKEVEEQKEVILKHIKRKRCDMRVCPKLSKFEEPVAKPEGGLMGSRKRRRRSQ